MRPLTTKRRWFLPALLLPIIVILQSPVVVASVEPVFWNKLGSSDEIASSEVGPGGQLLTDSRIEFVPGYFGGALKAKDGLTTAVIFPGPGVIPSGLDAGAIEFWAQLDDLPGGVITNGHDPMFFWVNQTDDVSNAYGINFNSNNGNGSGGLAGRAGNKYTTGTGVYGSHYTFEGILGDKHSWHHYALVWDAGGIAGVDDGTRKVALFLDGILESGRWQTTADVGFPALGVGSEFRIPGITPIWADPFLDVTIDNFKVWDFAKTDFSDRFEEGDPICFDATVDFAENPIDGGFAYERPSVADLDEDGDLDIVVTLPAAPGGVLWYENDGAASPSFTKHTIRTGPNLTHNAVGDMDGDGDLDIAAGDADIAGPIFELAWYENLGGTPPVFGVTHVLSSGFRGWWDLVVADVNGDGRDEVVSGNSLSFHLSWFEMIPGAPPTFTEHIIRSDSEDYLGLSAADLDNDGDIDLVNQTGSFPSDSNELSWYENSGGPTPTFVRRVIGSGTRAYSILSADIDRDGDVDIFAAYLTEDRVSWYESDGGTPPAFTEHLFDLVDAPRDLQVGDIDKNGTLDVIVSSTDTAGAAWYSNDGGSPPAFTRNVMPGAPARGGVAAGDLDGDLDVDVVSVDFITNLNRELLWYENLIMPDEAPEIACTGLIFENDAGVCSATADCVEIAFCADPEMQTVAQACDLLGPYDVGTTDVVVTCEDACNTVIETCQVAVVDVESPTITVELAPSTLWPPNHRMIDVEANVMLADNCDMPTFLLTSVSSNEADNGQGDGNTVNDIQNAEVNTSDLQFSLRAERAGGGNGRIYTAIYTATDGSGSSASDAGFVTVVHDQGGTMDPLQILLKETGIGTEVWWNDVPGAESYDVIRGDLGNLTETAVVIDLGAVICVEADSADCDTQGSEDPTIPEQGEAFFYLVQYFDGTTSSYGTESSDMPRAPGPGDCE